MSDLGAWLDANELSEDTITIKGKTFLVVEITLAEQGKLLGKFADKDGNITNECVENLMMSRCVLDPENRDQVRPVEDWQKWSNLGASFIPLRRKVLQLNGLTGTDEAVKN